MPTVKKGYSLMQAYTFYRKKYENDKNKVLKKMYIDICQDFNKMLMEEAMNKPSGVKLPFSMGTIWVKKFKISWKNPPIDLAESKRLKKKVYHINHETDEWCCRWKWSKRNNLITNLIYYSFTPSRKNARTLSKHFRQNNNHRKYFTFQTI